MSDFDDLLGRDSEQIQGFIASVIASNASSKVQCDIDLRTANKKYITDFIDLQCLNARDSQSLKAKLYTLRVFAWQLHSCILGSLYFNDGVKDRLTIGRHILGYMVDSVSPAAVHKLLIIVKLSKLDAKLSIAASNAMTLVGLASDVLEDEDLSGVRIPHARLDGLLVTGATTFEGADLSHTSWRGCTFVGTTFTDARADGAKVHWDTYVTPMRQVCTPLWHHTHACMSE